MTQPPSSLTISASKEAAFTSARPEHENFLADHNSCCLCGSELLFVRALDYEACQMQETTECPSCRIRSRPKLFSLS